ncbi:MAG TPA: cellulase family glycosylhydrolase [Tepidisphaeraceae bacterium]|jgi:endo-1,4-beta-mannosidase|nr:cellulase family glycosylhydrolase [Tepidisphaeraceae bacterium]
MPFRNLLIILTILLPSLTRAANIATISPNHHDLLVGSQIFHPWGFNYDRDYKFRLLEEYWHTEWPTVVADFQEMKALGANTVRIHLQLHEFLDTPDHPNQKNLAKLHDLLQLATDTGLKLDLTGLCCFRKELTPPWYTNADEPERWRIQSNFWRAIATTCKGSPAVLFYDLINEPLVPTGKCNDFLVGHLADFYYCQYITLDQKSRPRDQIAAQWIHTMKSAIRQVDPDHLISVGILPNSTTLAPGQSGFLPATVSRELDLLCVHLYPHKPGKEQDDDLATLHSFAAAGKPVIIEETFPLNSGTEGMRQFLHRAHPDSTGVLGFYWGQTIQDLNAHPSIPNAIIADWLTLFSKGWPS